MASAVDPVAPREVAAFPSRGPVSILQGWHLLSLDAPSIAALWCYFFARTMAIRLPWHSPLLLGMGTWLIYVADRILDGYRRDSTGALHPRHWFHAKYRRTFLGTAIAAGATLVWLIVTRMAENARREDTFLFLVAVLYLGVVHRPGRFTKTLLPKELAVGVIFAAATAVPAWSRLVSGQRTLVPAVGIFAALCWLNCVAIERWESPRLLSCGESQLAAAHVTTRWMANHLQIAACLLAGVSGGLAGLQLCRTEAVRTSAIYGAAMTAGIVFACLDRYRDRFDAMQLRIAADAALLTPLLFLPFMRG